PSAAGLVGIGLAAMWQAHRAHERGRWLLPVALAGSALMEAAILGAYPGWETGFGVAVAVVAFATAAVLTASAVRWSGRSTRLALAGSAVGIAALLAPLATWGGISVFRQQNSADLSAGPSQGSFGRFQAGRAPRPGAGFDGQTSQALIDYLEANRGSTRYLVGVTNANAAAPIILATGQPVMALGGFIGRDPILSPDQLAAEVDAGTIRYFLVSGAGRAVGFTGAAGGGTLAGEDLAWVSQH
ncbi:MAG TPA: hypothetical protein VKU60_13490, partial [Chloroflexota bacterium]|nr:hypothetical protein [Chloroflexota bacterium]